MFDGTIADNIRWGRPDATDDDVERAARAADVHRFVQDLPDKYATRVGQRGRLLSGGQRQRLAIARAMIRDAPVLLLDEPTTGLDAESTERVLAPLRRLMAGRTTLMISHNLLTVTDADRIVFLEDGRIGAVGAHAELLTRSPGYARLYRLHHPDAAARTDSPHRHRPRRFRAALDRAPPPARGRGVPCRPRHRRRPARRRPLTPRRTAPTGSTRTPRTRPPSGSGCRSPAPRHGRDGIAVPGRPARSRFPRRRRTEPPGVRRGAELRRWRR